MSRRRQIPWIHRMSRPLLVGIASLGAANTGYLTLAKFLGWHTLCPTDKLSAALNCDKVLSSDYAQILGLPLPLFGFAAYLFIIGLALAPTIFNSDQHKEFRTLVIQWTWLFLLVTTMVMTVFSGYLMYLLVNVIQSGCLYCIGSALTATLLLILVLVGKEWESLGQILLIGITTTMITLIGTLGIYAAVSNPGTNSIASPNAAPLVVSASGSAEIELAQHLKQIGARMYGAYWCPHCHEQKELFGKEADHIVPYVECADDGKNSQVALCRLTGITGFPTWEINGQLFSGVQDLNKLAELSGYQGSRSFRNN